MWQSIVGPRLHFRIVYLLDTFGPYHLGFSKKTGGMAVPAMETLLKLAFQAAQSVAGTN
jgi:hypothetical protein